MFSVTTILVAVVKGKDITKTEEDTIASLQIIIEALSRGAERVVMVDSSKESVQIMRFNVDMIKEDAEVVLADAFSFVSTTREKFDIIFLDPPYDIDATPVLEAIAKNGLLNEDGIVIYEHSEDFKVGEIEGLEHFNTRKYGIAHFEFYGELK